MKLTKFLLQKMRLNPIYFRLQRPPQRESEVPFKEVYSLKLKNTVSGTVKRNLEDKCLFEMSLLFACWKKTDFDNSQCKNFIQQLEICHRNLLKTTKEEKIIRRRDIPTPKAKNMTDKQLTYLLHKYPTV